MRRFTGTGAATALVVGLMAIELPAQEPHDPPINYESVIVNARSAGMRRGGAMGNYRDFNEVTKDTEKIEGLFTFYKKPDHLYAEIRPDQFNHPFLAPMMIARGLAGAGNPIGDEEMVLVFKRVGERIQVIRRNIHYKAPAGSSLDKAVKQNYTDSVLMALPIITINMMKGGAPVVDFADIFLTDFAQLGIGMLDRSRSSWAKVKGFPNNMEIEVEATFAGAGRRGMGGQEIVADARGVTVVIHYSLMRTPDPGYHPRLADDRVGHFLSASKDFGSNDPDTNFVRQINRWRLEKANPQSRLSPPKKQIIWYVEDTVPIEYRPYVEDGIREWNKAFEKIGFRDAIAVRWAEVGRDDFDPEDTNYCTFRWITTGQSYAMSCLRANPLTGEMIDGDVIFDASMVQYWKREYALLIGNTAAPGAQPTPIAVGEVLSPILAAKLGYGQPWARGLLGIEGIEALSGKPTLEAVPSDQNLMSWSLARHMALGTRGFCQFQGGLQRDFALAAMALADSAAVADKKDEKAKGEKGKDDKKPEAKKPEIKKPDPAAELTEEFIGQAIKHITMHEVGHSLGLRHNFKSSTMLTADQLNDTAITRSRGLVGSVMDYSPVNIAPRGKKQGDYYSTTIGPYDYWAIEYAYKPIMGDEAAELKKLASRAPEHDLVYATDEDAAFNDDPYVNRFDLGADPCEFGKERIALASELLKTLDARVVKDGESWNRARSAFGILLNQWGDGAVLASQYIGGQSVSRDHKADKGARDPIVPVAGAKQRECLNFLSETILSDKSFQFSPALLRRLGAERWLHWGVNFSASPAVDISLFERVLGIQKIVLSHCLAGPTLARLQNQQLQADPATNPLRIDEVFRGLTEASWSDVAAPAKGKDGKRPPFTLSTIRRNLQREYVRRLSVMVLGSGGRGLGDAYGYLVIMRGGGNSVPADARALARLHLKEISGRIANLVDTPGLSIDDVTRAHLEEIRHRINKVLEANLDVQEP